MSEKEEFQIQEVKTDKEGNLMQIVSKDGKTINKNYSEYTELGRFIVRYFVPQTTDTNLTFIKPNQFIDSEGNIAQISPYWRKGIWVGKKEDGKPILLTYIYHGVGDAVMFGDLVMGSAVIKKVTNNKKKEERIIIDFFPLDKERQEKWAKAPIFVVRLSEKENLQGKFCRKIPGTKFFLTVIPLPTKKK